MRGVPRVGAAGQPPQQQPAQPRVEYGDDGERSGQQPAGADLTEQGVAGAEQPGADGEVPGGGAFGEGRALGVVEVAQEVAEGGVREGGGVFAAAQRPVGEGAQPAVLLGARVRRRSGLAQYVEHLVDGARQTAGEPVHEGGEAGQRGEIAVAAELELYADAHLVQVEVAQA